MSFERDYYENRAFWDADYYLEDPAEQERWLTAMSLIPKDVQSLIDVGCGNGIFLHKLEKEKLFKCLIGSERSKIAIENKICTAEVVNESIDNLSAKNNAYDCVSCMEVIEHLPVPIYKQSLSELERIARKYILLTVPFKEDRKHIQCPSCNCLFNYDYHMRSYGQINVENLFDNFKLANHKIIMGDHYLGVKRIKDLFYRKKYPFRPNALCPQCGYTEKNKHSEALKIETISRFNKALKKAWPTYKKERWFLGLYIRK